MITSLRIENFKCWKDTGEFRLAPITGFFGSNSSGKTSILQLLLMLKQTVESRDRNLVLNLGNEEEKDYVQLGTLRDVLYQDLHFSNAHVLSWALQWENSLNDMGNKDKDAILKAASHIKLSASVLLKESEGTSSITLDKFDYFLEGESIPSSSRLGLFLGNDSFYHLVDTESTRHLTAEEDDSAYEQPTKFYGFPEIFAELSRTYFMEDLEHSVEQLFKTVYYLGPLREYPARQYTWGGGQPSDVGIRGKNAVAALLASRRRKTENGTTVEQKVAEWLQRLGLIHSFKIEEIAKDSSLFIVRVQQSPDAAFVPITDVGFGVSQVLPVLTLCYYVPQGSILIFEQPEIHLHPAVQTGLADVFIEVARERNLQIILESHSEHLLTRLQRRIAEKAIGHEDVHLYFCERDGAQAHLKPLKINNFGFITNWPTNFFGDEMAERSAMMLAAVERQQNGETE